MKLRSLGRISGVLMLTMVACGGGQYVRTLAWLPPGSPAEFPEMEEVDAIRHARASGERLRGVVFSGGGMRSATATVGQLRMLREWGWLDDFHYVSAVSGGSWSAIPYLYSPLGQESEFLGENRAPSDITPEYLSRPQGAHAGRIADAKLLRDLLDGWLALKGDEAFAHAVGKTFLSGLGLYDSDSAKFFTWDAVTRDRLLAEREFDPRVTAADFHVVPPGRSFWIAGLTLQYPPHVPNISRPDIHPFEVTPLYAGVASNPVDRGFTDRFGGYREPFGYDSEAPEAGLEEDGTAWVRLGKDRHRFSLADVLAASGSAPTATLGLTHLGLPEFRHWPLTERGALEDREYQHGDGGNIDNIGVPALLARGVDDILVFVNTMRPFNPKQSDFSVRGRRAALYEDVIDYFLASRQRPRNQVFDSEGSPQQPKPLKRLRSAFRELQAEGKPLVFCDTYKVIPNETFNVRRTYEPRICWVYLDRVSTWVNQLTSAGEVGDQIRDQQGPFMWFPHFDTFLQLNLSVAQVNALAALASWTVETNRGYIGSYLELE